MRERERERERDIYIYIYVYRYIYIYTYLTSLNKACNQRAVPAILFIVVKSASKAVTQAYAGSTMPADIAIPSGTSEIVWRSDGSVTTGGWIFRLPGPFLKGPSIPIGDNLGPNGFLHGP